MPATAANPDASGRGLRVLVFGTFDMDGGRLRPLCAAMERRGWELRFCHRRFWSGSAAKVKAFGPLALLATVARAALVYPGLLWQAWWSRPFDLMLVPTGGFVDILWGWPAARRAGACLVFDPLYGLWETVVEDRRLIPPRGLRAWLLERLERFCFRLADRVLVDTEDHIPYFVQRGGVAPERLLVVPVGAEEELFTPAREATASAAAPSPGVEVLFYGTMIPLHGADTIVRAAALVDDPTIRFTVIGRGQMSAQVEGLARELGCRNLSFVPAVPYDQLPGHIRRADICLGIFGTTQKAQDVVPTKVHQCLAAGRPIITGDTPAARRVLCPGQAVLTVPCGDPPALAAAVRQLARDPQRRADLGRAARRLFEDEFSAAALARRLQPLEERDP